jgi:hypothetical protein
LSRVNTLFGSRPPSSPTFPLFLFGSLLRCLLFLLSSSRSRLRRERIPRGVDDGRGGGRWGKPMSRSSSGGGSCSCCCRGEGRRRGWRRRRAWSRRRPRSRHVSESADISRRGSVPLRHHLLIEKVAPTRFERAMRRRRVILPDATVALSGAATGRAIEVACAEVADVDAEVAAEDGRALFEPGREDLAADAGGAGEGFSGARGQRRELRLQGWVVRSLQSRLQDRSFET